MGSSAEVNRLKWYALVGVVFSLIHYGVRRVIDGERPPATTNFITWPIAISEDNMGTQWAEFFPILIYYTGVFAVTSWLMDKNHNTKSGTDGIPWVAMVYFVVWSGFGALSGIIQGVA